MNWEDAPPLGDEHEIWGITQLLLKRKVDLVIDMNVYADLRWGQEEKDENDLVLEMCAKENIPYVGLDNYPIAEVIKKFNTDYLSDTISFSIALAMYRGFSKIDFYGVSYPQGTRYAAKKPGVDFWLGYAKGYGVDLTIHGDSFLMKTNDGLLYGYDWEQAKGRIDDKGGVPWQ